jgi:hypothetical protein
MTPQRLKCFATAKQIAVKKYMVKLSEEERELLKTLIHAGRHPARLLTKARILLKADASEGGEGWSDSQVAEAPLRILVVEFCKSRARRSLG